MLFSLQLCFISEKDIPATLILDNTTKFVFTNHGKHYEPTVTSYDYSAPLTEWGDYTETYHKVRKLICLEENKMQH